MNIKLLKNCFCPIEDIFKLFDNHILDGKDIEKRRIFIDCKADVLFVAHLDTVLPPKIHKITNKRIDAQGLDDRLGLYYILSLLKSGIKADVLLTDHEETCKSTAQYHTCKNYNWIVEFDRAGTDFVTYGCANKDLKKELSKTWAEGVGSFTDICFLPTNAACFNLGIGYDKAHNKDSSVKISDIDKQLGFFRSFYTLHKDIKYTQDGSDIEKNSGFNWGNNRYNDLCDRCGQYGAKEIHGYMVCQDCIDSFMIGSKDRKPDGKCAYCGCDADTTYSEAYGDQLCIDCKQYILEKFS